MKEAVIVVNFVEKIDITLIQNVFEKAPNELLIFCHSHLGILPQLNRGSPFGAFQRPERGSNPPMRQSTGP